MSETLTSFHVVNSVQNVFQMTNQSFRGILQVEKGFSGNGERSPGGLPGGSVSQFPPLPKPER